MKSACVGVGALLTTSLVCVATLAANAGATPANEAARLVLTKRDVGTAYRLNASFTSAHTLREVSVNAPPSIKRELARKWVAGMQTGFNGVTVRRGIISTADVFRTPNIDAIVRHWQRLYLRNSRGKLLPVPEHAPGTSRILIRGRMVSDTVLLYFWVHGPRILTVWQFGPSASLRPKQLFELARRQDAKVS